MNIQSCLMAGDFSYLLVCKDQHRCINFVLFFDSFIHSLTLTSQNWTWRHCDRWGIWQHSPDGMMTLLMMSWRSCTLMHVQAQMHTFRHHICNYFKGRLWHCHASSFKRTCLLATAVQSLWHALQPWVKSRFSWFWCLHRLWPTAGQTRDSSQQPNSALTFFFTCTSACTLTCTSVRTFFVNS